MTLQGWPHDPSLSRGTTLGVEPARDRAAPTHARPRGPAPRARGRAGAGRGYGERGAGPRRGLGAAPPAKLLAGAAPGRAVRAGASRLWPRPLSSPGAAVALGVGEGSGGPSSVAAGVGLLGDRDAGTVAVVGRLLRDCSPGLQGPGCPGAVASWDGKIAARERRVSAGARRGSLERVRGARPRLWGSAARARALPTSLGSILVPAWARTAPSRTCAERRAVSSKARGYQGTVRTFNSPFGAATCQMISCL